MPFQQDTSEQGYSPARPFLVRQEGSGIQTGVELACGNIVNEGQLAWGSFQLCNLCCTPTVSEVLVFKTSLASLGVWLVRMDHGNPTTTGCWCYLLALLPPPAKLGVLTCAPVNTDWLLWLRTNSRFPSLFSCLWPCP